MPFRSDNPIVQLELDSMHTIDTSNPQNLYGLWSVFSKCAGAMEDGRRLENLSWRLWYQETIFCSPEYTLESTTPTSRLAESELLVGVSDSVPQLSSSVESTASNDLPPPPPPPPPKSLPVRKDSVGPRSPKHITPIALQNIVSTIKESKFPTKMTSNSSPMGPVSNHHSSSPISSHPAKPLMPPSPSKISHTPSNTIPNNNVLSSTDDSIPKTLLPAHTPTTQNNILPTPFHTSTTVPSSTAAATSFGVSPRTALSPPSVKSPTSHSPIHSIALRDRSFSAATSPHDHAPAMSTIPEDALEAAATTDDFHPNVATTLRSDVGSIGGRSMSETAHTEASGNSIVRGFGPGRISSFVRSKSSVTRSPVCSMDDNNSDSMNLIDANRKKGRATFTLGGSSGDDECSFGSNYSHDNSAHESCSPAKKGKKQASFNEEVLTRTITNNQTNHAYESEEVFESDSDDYSESAIEDDDDDDDMGEWEDAEDDDESGPSSFQEREMFQRVDSKPNLTSRHSLLTSLMHETDRAQAFQNAATRSANPLRRSRGISPNRNSANPLATNNNNNNNNNNNRSALTTANAQGQGLHALSVARPIPASATASPQAPLSPRTTRINMVTTELSRSLRQQLWWERQQKTQNNAALKRRHTSLDIRNLQNYPREGGPGPDGDKKGGAKPDAWKAAEAYFSNGLEEYHERGW